MAAETPPALGLSIGSTNLAAVTAEHAVTRKPVLTLYRQRPPEVGVPSENSRLDEPGVVITDFVDRVGDPAGIVAADGSLHRSEALIADTLRALAYAATGGRALPENVAVTYPSHWDSATVDILGSALSRVSEWSNRARPLVLIPDAAAALFAARANPGIPAGGTSQRAIAVCDFGGTGTSITLMDAGGDYRSLAPTARYHDLSGNLIDQALLSAVMGNVPGTRSFDPSSALASGLLSRLRAECRTAKEQLSSSTTTTLTDELPGMHGDFRLTRTELDEVIREPLDNFLAFLQQTLARNGIRDLAGVVMVGGGANIPVLTTTLSARLRVPVITRQRPQLTPAVGAALRATHHPSRRAVTRANPVTMENPAAPVPVTVPQPPAGATDSATDLAWPRRSVSRVSPNAAADTVVRPAPPPEVPADPGPEPSPPPKSIRWYRRLPALAAIGAAVVLAVAGIALAIATHSRNQPTTAPPPSRTMAPSSTTSAPSAAPSATPASPAPSPPPASPSPTQEAPPPSPSDSNPPAQTETPTTTVPPATPQAQPPAVAAPAVPLIPRVPAIPALPPIPGVDAPIPGLDRINQILQEFGVGPIGQ